MQDNMKEYLEVCKELEEITDEVNRLKGEKEELARIIIEELQSHAD